MYLESILNAHRLKSNHGTCIWYMNAVLGSLPQPFLARRLTCIVDHDQNKSSYMS